MIKKANEYYYIGDTYKNPILDDNTYDILKEYIERTYPKNKIIKDSIYIWKI